MSDKKTKAEELVEGIASLMGIEKTRLASELAPGEYVLGGELEGTTFRITEEGDVVDVKAPTAEAAEAEEAAKDMADAEVATMKKQIADLTEALELSKTEIVKLSETKKIIPSVKEKTVLKKIEITAAMSPGKRAQALFINAKNGL